MANPLKDGVGTRAKLSDMQPGETRPWSEVEGRMIFFTRTDRPLTLDLCDANNASMGRGARNRGLEWFVSSSGELKLGTSQQAMMAHVKADKARLERERQAYIANLRRPESNDNATIAPDDAA